MHPRHADAAEEERTTMKLEILQYTGMRFYTFRIKGSSEPFYGKPFPTVDMAVKAGERAMKRAQKRVQMLRTSN
jgi:hypothetical protein